MLASVTVAPELLQREKKAAAAAAAAQGDSIAVASRPAPPTEKQMDAEAELLSKLPQARLSANIELRLDTCPLPLDLWPLTSDPPLTSHA